MSEIRKMLFVTKFEELGFDALQSLLTLRQADLEHVVFMNVIERDKVALHRGKGYQKGEEIRLREAANIRFIDWAETLFEEGMEVGVYIVVGTMVSQVLKAAEKEGSDLIVIGRPVRKGGLNYLYSGSAVTELLRRSAVPVLVYKGMAENNYLIDKPFSRPLLATDWEAASRRAVEYLKPLRGVIEKVHVMHVADEKALSKKASAMEIQRTRKVTRHKLEEICDDLEASGITARPLIYVGDPDEEIERAAQECKASLVVLGSSSRSAWAERWLGSTPRQIAEKSPYPTLLIPPAKALAAG
ncbi:MAG: universal stress protein [Desulfosarcinaceae bacterium]|nr:universal stress protein [Desulfosarcinaceae bacterium]